MNPRESDELCDEELQRIERLVDAATAGPWISCLVGRDAQAESNCIELGSCNELGSFLCVELLGGSVADQEFVASARQDIPRLLREVRALRARLDSLLVEPRRRPAGANRGIVDGTTTLHSSPM
jgi:hypothetical protein